MYVYNKILFEMVSYQCFLEENSDNTKSGQQTLQTMTMISRNGLLEVNETSKMSIGKYLKDEK